MNKHLRNLGNARRVGFVRPAVLAALLLFSAGVYLTYHSATEYSSSCQPAALPARPVAFATHTKAIEDVCAGDRVWAYDPQSGRWTPKEVLKPLVHEYAGDLVTVTVAGHTVQATGNHPFWVEDGKDLHSRPLARDLPISDQTRPTRGRWVEARHLEAGDVLVLRNGGLVPIEMVAVRRTQQTVYNLKVADLHTYAVGEMGIAVHNKPCFPPGTLVLLGDGSTKPIEKIELGDVVLARNPDSRGPARPAEVSGLIRDFASGLVHLMFSEPGGRSATVAASRFHPFWTRNRGWVESWRLQPGDLLETQTGSIAVVCSVAITAEVSRTYNLTVAGVHTYYVVDGRASVLVHNAGDPGTVPGTLYHYTPNPPSSFSGGLRPNSWVTDNGNMSPWEAMQQLGVPQPKYVYPITDDGDFVPAGVVDPAGYQMYYPPGGGNPVKIPVTGGANQYTNPDWIPPEQIGQPKALSQGAQMFPKFVGTPLAGLC